MGSDPCLLKWAAITVFIEMGSDLALDKLIAFSGNAAEAEGDAGADFFCYSHNILHLYTLIYLLNNE